MWPYKTNNSYYFDRHGYHVTPEQLREIAEKMEKDDVKSIYFIIAAGEICERFIKNEQ